MSPFRVELLGGFQLSREGEPVAPPVSRAARSLFAYLVVNRGRTHTRDHLAGVFWPDLDDSTARRRLSHALWQIKTAVAAAGLPGVVDAEAEAVSIREDAPVTVDVAEFLAGVARPDVGAGGDAPFHEIPRLRSAVELYRGDFLDGYYVDWADVEQRRLRQDYLGALARLVQALKAAGEYEDALTYARRLTWHEPLREDAHREVMRLCVLVDRHAEALQHYERCVGILSTELGADPEPATQDLFEQISSQRESREQPAEARVGRDGSADIPLVGRVTERGRAVDVIDRTIGGTGGVVLVEGEPGVGKTRFLRELTDAAKWRGVEALWGAAQAGVPAPFGAIREALASGLSPLRAQQLAEQVDPVWLIEVARVVPQLREWLPGLPVPARLSPAEGRDRMVEAITVVLTAFGRITPHVIVFDDVQWVDADSIGVIRHLTTSAPLGRLAVFVSFRDSEGRERDDLWPVLTELDRLGAERLHLQPLTAPETGRLVRSVLPRTLPAHPLVERIHHETGGNPLFTIETARVLADLPVARLDPDGLPISADVREVISARVEGLAPDERVIANSLAVFGEAASADQLFQWSPLSRSAVLTAVGGLLARRIVEERDDAYGFAHEQLRRITYELIPSASRARLHRTVAESLALSGHDEPASLAHHLRLAGEHRRAFTYEVEAGRRAVALHAYATAAEHYEQALTVEVDDSAGSQIEVLAEYELVLATLGRRSRQRSVLDRWASVAAAGTEWAVQERTRRSEYLAAGDDYGPALEVAIEAIAKAQEIGVGAARARLAAGRALAWSGHVRDSLDQLRGAARDAPGDAEIAVALGAALSDAQLYGEAERELLRGLAQSREDGDPRGEAEALGHLATLAVERGDSAAAETSLLRAIELCGQIGFTYGMAVNRANLGSQYYFTGRIAEAIEADEAAVKMFTAVQNRRGAAMMLANVAGIRHRVLGEDESAEEQSLEARAFFDEVGNETGAAQCNETLGSIAARRGDASSARRYLDLALEQVLRSGNRWREGFVRRTRAAVLSDLGDHPAALEEIAAARRTAGPDLAILLDALEGLVRSRQGDDTALDVASRGMRLHRAGGPMSWAIPYMYSVVAHRAGIMDESKEAIQRAYDLLDRALAGFDGERRVRALQSVPMNADIMRLWSRMQPSRISMEIAALEAPTGRPLRADERVQVEWAVEPVASGAGPADRQAALVQLIDQANEQGGAPTVPELASVLAVSRSTVKRDLAALRAAGVTLRTRGSRER